MSMRTLIVLVLAGALLFPLVIVQGDDAVCVSVSVGSQTSDGTGDGTGSFLNTGQAIVGVTTDGNVEVLAGIMHCMLVSGLSPTGDCDVSLFVDLPDLPTLTRNDCMLGPVNPFINPSCSCSDYNEDGRIDLLDAAAFQRAISN